MALVDRRDAARVVADPAGKLPAMKIENAPPGTPR
jgi:hypothetical protein